jgi:hypothetical protein
MTGYLYAPHVLPSSTARPSGQGKLEEIVSTVNTASLANSSFAPSFELSTSSPRHCLQ